MDTVIVLPGPLHRVVADKISRLIQEVALTPEWGQDDSAEGEMVEIIVRRIPVSPAAPVARSA